MKDLPPELQKLRQIQMEALDAIKAEMLNQWENWAVIEADPYLVVASEERLEERYTALEIAHQNVTAMAEKLEL